MTKNALSAEFEEHSPKLVGEYEVYVWVILCEKNKEKQFLHSLDMHTTKEKPDSHVVKEIVLKWF